MTAPVPHGQMCGNPVIWAHARRYIYEAQAEHPKATRVALKLIARERAWDEQGVGRDHVRVWLRARHYARTLRWLKTLALKGREKVLP